MLFSIFFSCVVELWLQFFARCGGDLYVCYVGCFFLDFLDYLDYLVFSRWSG